MKYYNKSIEGSSHKITGLPCQDFSECEFFDFNQKQVLIMTVSDGHGSKTYVRSHIGSQLACKIAIDETKRFVIDNYDNLINKGKIVVSYSPDFGVPQDPLFADLFSSIHNHWYEEIIKNSKETPFTNEEKSKLGNADIKQAYGCTLIVCVKSSDFVFAFHLGDGRLYFISGYNEWTQPVPWDSDCEDNITTSLCEENPVGRFRYYLDTTNSQPFGIFMCSDGIEDCYRGTHDANFESENLIVDYSEVIRCFLQDEDFDKDCCDFLSKQSEDISHDDMSIAFVVDDVYNIQGKWLKLYELRRFEFKIQSMIDSFSNKIKEIDNRIANIYSYISNYAIKINELESNKKKKNDNIETLVQKQKEARTCAESASRFNVKIGEFQVAIKEYCDEFCTQADNTNDNQSFRVNLTEYILKALNSALTKIRQVIIENRNSDSNCNNEIEALKNEISEIDSKLEQANKDKEEEKNKLEKLEERKKEIEKEAELFEKENKTKRNECLIEAKNIKEEIRHILPHQPEGKRDIVKCKTLNICKMSNGTQDKDLTITYSQNEIWGQWDGENYFPISKEKFDELINKIRGADSSLYEDKAMSGDYVAIMVLDESKEKDQIRYISFLKQETVELWKICLGLSSSNETK